MLSWRNAWRAHNARTLLIAGIWAVLVQPATAQTDPHSPSPADGIALFQRVEAWVTQGALPAEMPAEASDWSYGASVVIRLDGRVIGRGSNVSPEAGFGRCLAAAGDAIQSAKSDFKEAARGNVENQLTISLELAGELIPMRLAQGEGLAMRMSPGLDGLAMRRGSQTVAWYPSRMLERDALPSAVLGPLVSILGGPASEQFLSGFELQELGYTMYRFRTMHLASPRPGMSPVFLHRGGRVVDSGSVTVDGMREMVEGLIGHLVGMRWLGDEAFGLGGALEPVSGLRASIVADPLIQGTTAMALLRAAGVTGIDPATAERARAMGEQLLRDLAVVVEPEREPWSTTSMASACVVALAEVSAERIEMDDALRGLKERCLKSVREGFGPKSGFVDAKPSETAIVALALVRDAAEFGGDFEKAKAAVNRVYRDTPAGMLVSQMPWLGWASLGLAELSSDQSGGGVVAAIRLRSMRGLVWEHQLRSVDLSFDDRDLAGGVVFTSGTTPLPTWQSVRPISFIASMLGYAELTSGGMNQGEWPGELVRVLDSIRFFKQLCAGVEEGHMYRRPGLAMWSVRASMWDQSMPTEASVLTLLAVCETLDAMEKRASVEP